MSFKGKLLSVVAVASALAFAAPASAQTLEVTDETTGSHCPAVSLSGHSVSGGCLFHVKSNGTFDLRKHHFGIESSLGQCNEEFSGRINEDGSGYLFDQLVTGCQWEACYEGSDISDEIPWSVAGSESGLGTETMTIVICHQEQGQCEVEFPFIATGDHQYRLGQVAEIPGHGVAGFRCELVGTWNTETGGAGEQSIEVTHLN